MRTLLFIDEALHRLVNSIIDLGLTRRVTKKYAGIKL